MPFCTDCGRPVDHNSNFCTTCGVGKVPLDTRRLKPFGIVLLIIGAFYLLMAMTRYESAGYQLLAAFGGSDASLDLWVLYGLAALASGIYILSSKPDLFLTLNQSGLVAFSALMAVLPVLCWIPWLIPTLRQKVPQPPALGPTAIQAPIQPPQGVGHPLLQVSQAVPPASLMHFCTQCGQKYEGTVKFCPNCGAAL